MEIGPVFRAELVRNARRRIAYWLRLAYGFLLLFVIWTNYAPLAARSASRGLYFQDLAQFALNTFIAFMVVQIAALLVLIPALCGGAVADEKQRKTLHYLMASQLTSREIIVDKLLARLFHLGVYVLLGIPVMSLLSLFGGVPWEYVAVGYTATFSIGFFAAALAVFVSVLSRRVRQGVLLAYLIEVGWLIGPPLCAGFVGAVFPQTFQWIGPLYAFGMNSSPVSLYVMLSVGGPGLWRGPSQALPYFEGMVGLQLCGGMLLLVLSVLLLRPVFRRQEDKPRRLNWFHAPRRARVFARPACGDDAMLWKERYFTRTDVFTKLVVLPATIVVTVGLVLGSQLDETVGRVVGDYWQNGTAAALDRERLASAVQMVTYCYATLWLLAVAGASASCMTVEREQDTWVSLISSPLGAREIVRGKVLGAVWGLRGFGVLLTIFWLIALLLGAISVPGLLLAGLTFAVLTWFVAALGSYVSLLARNTARALTTTILVLVLLNGGCQAVVWPLRAVGLITAREPDMLVFTPLLISGALTVPERLAFIGEHANQRSVAALSGLVAYQELVYGALIAVLYGAAALVLTLRTAGAFDRINDRPRMPTEAVPRRVAQDAEGLVLSRTTD
ncbi:MAG: ABC transporter permease subunit [Isosphaeraceae bacterium]|nr:ABC transporter permease subunit [Isosphaeraceae bacterium]